MTSAATWAGDLSGTVWGVPFESAASSTVITNADREPDTRPAVAAAGDGPGCCLAAGWAFAVPAVPIVMAATASSRPQITLIHLGNAPIRPWGPAPDAGRGRCRRGRDTEPQPDRELAAATMPRPAELPQVTSNLIGDPLTVPDRGTTGDAVTPTFSTQPGAIRFSRTGR